MKEIISAVKQGGADIKSNSKLRIAVQKAKDVNMPNENVERNIKKASSADQQDFTEMSYELYGFGGVGIIVDILTDNRNRISGEIQIAVNKNGGTIATPGAVSYNFDRKGLIKVLKSAISEDDLFLLVSEAGADDFSSEDEVYVITTPVKSWNEVKEAIEARGLKCEEASLAMIPKSLVEVSDEEADKNIALIEFLENIDDVDEVFHNMKV